jgi:dolichol-phosphate mannosyltransferase
MNLVKHGVSVLSSATAEVLPKHGPARKWPISYRAVEPTAEKSVVSAHSELGPELTVVIPTKNERDNIVTLYTRLGVALKDLNWEVIFVDDDSDDGTPEIIRGIARQDRHARLVHRIGRRGLSSACIEGIQASTSPYVAVMDADLQHDERLLPKMLETLRNESVDIVVGSRYIAGGSIGQWDHQRVFLSSLATRVGRYVLNIPILDPMSGFFMVRREAFQGAIRNLSAMGFKILIDLFASSTQTLRAKELPYTFSPRHSGESKLDNLVGLEYLILLTDKLVGHLVPIRFVQFAIVGASGVISHLFALWFLLKVFQFPFIVSQLVATALAMIGNFVLNNAFTYRDQRLSGFAFLQGLASFVAICGFGALANVSIASLLYGDRRAAWWLAGLAGAVMSSVWNYSVSSVLTWRKY